MRIAARHRLAAGGGLLSAALVAGLLVTTAAGPASAVARPTEPLVTNDQNTRVGFTTDVDVLTGSTVTFTRRVNGAAAEAFTAQVDQSPPSAALPPTFRTPSAMVNFSAPTYAGTNQPTGPANPGTYDVQFTPGTLSPPGSASEGCSACFTVGTTTAPTATGATPSGLQRGASAQTVTLTGTGFSRDTAVQVLRADGTVDPTVVFSAPAAGARATLTTLARSVTVAADAPLGARTLRLVGTNSQTSDCPGCFSILGASFAGIDPIASSNTTDRSAVSIVFTATQGFPFPTDAQPSLRYDRADTGSSTAAGLSLVPSSVTRAADGSTLTGVFDLRAAAPGANAYLPTVTSATGGVSTTSTRFSVDQPTAPVVSGAVPATQAAGTAQRVTVSGTGFAKGAVVTLTGGGNPLMPAPTVTGTDVQFVSSTTLSVLFTLPADAPTGNRNVVVRNTDNAADDLPGGYAVTAAASPTPSATPTTSPTSSPTSSPTPSRSATPSPTPTRSATPSATPTATVTPSATPTSASPSPTAAPVRPVITLDRTTITSQEAATVRASARPGSVVELQAYSRPSTTYVVVRRGVVGSSGLIEFVVGPSGNTRMFLRSRDVNGGNQVDSDSIVLTVRTSINLKVTRTGTRTYRFTGSTLPKRRGQLVTVFYEAADGRRVIASRARVAQDGTYNVTRTFGSGGTFTLFTGTGTDINNAAGLSNRVRTVVR